MVSDQTETRKLREEAGLTQQEAANECDIPLRTFQAYDRGDREPPASKMDHIRTVLGGQKAPRDLPSTVRKVRVHHAGAGPGQSASGDEEILLDERLFEGSGVDFDGHEFIRIRGSSMEPILSHGQIVYCERTSNVSGQDLYVYWRGDEDGYVVAIIDSLPDGGLRIEKRGPSGSVTEWKHLREHMYESEAGQRVRLKIWGRVLGSFGRPAQQIAAEESAARHAAIALKA